MASRYGINRLIDSRNCYELLQKDFVISNNKAGIRNNDNHHEHIRTVEQIVSRDKGGMIISPQIGLHENVMALDYDSEYANLIVNHNLSYETVTLEGGSIRRQSNKKKGLLPTIVGRFLKRRLYFKSLLKELPNESVQYLWCEQRVNSLKNILVCLYGSTGSLWNRYGNVLAFEEINKISRDILIKTKDIVQGLGYELVYADTDSVFVKKKATTIQQKETMRNLSVYFPKKLVFQYPSTVITSSWFCYLWKPMKMIEVLKHYFGITYDDELVVRGIEIRRHDSPSFIKQFQTQLLYTLFDCENSDEVVTKGYDDALLLVTQAIDKIMTGEGILQQDLVISKLLRQDIDKYRSIFPHVSAAIQLSNNNNNNSNGSSGRYPTKGDTIQYIYTNSQHNNPLCRVVPIENQQRKKGKLLLSIIMTRKSTEKWYLMLAETVLGFFGFDRTVYSNFKKKGRKEMV